MFVTNVSLYDSLVFLIAVTVGHELIFSTQYFDMQVLVCKLSICNTNLFFCFALFWQHAIDLFIEFTGRSVTFILHVCISNERFKERGRKRGSISNRHRNIARKLTNFYLCYSVGSIYQFLLSTPRTCGRLAIKVWW